MDESGAAANSIAPKLRRWPNFTIPTRFSLPTRGCFRSSALGILLAAGAWLRDFSIRPAQVVLTFAAGSAGAERVLALQPASRARCAARSSPAFSVTLLLRADNLLASSDCRGRRDLLEVVLRLRGKHLFNPANFGVLFALALLPGSLDIGRPMGAGRRVCGMDGRAGHVRDAARAPRRYQLDLSRVLCRRAGAARRLSGPAMGRAGPSVENGGLLLFAFFMISDPMTIPNRRRGACAHAALVSAIAYVWQFCFYRTNGLLWALFIAAPSVPLWDAIWPAPKFQWTAKEKAMKRSDSSDYCTSRCSRSSRLDRGEPRGRARSAAFTSARPTPSSINHASQVVMVRHDDKTVLSLMNDYQGEPSEFALVVPVPEVLQNGQIHIGDRELFKQIDAYSSPRLVEYYDPDPCAIMRMMRGHGRDRRPMARRTAPAIQARAKSAGRHGRGAIHGRRIRHRDPVGQAIRRARDLAAARTATRFRRRQRALEPYMRQNMKFFVAKVNLKEHADRAQLSAPAAVRLRVAQVHAADSPRDDQRAGPAGPGRLRADRKRPRRDHQLSHREAAHRDGPARITSQTNSRDFYKAMFDDQVKLSDDAHGVHRVCVEYGMVRSVRGAAAVA